MTGSRTFRSKHIGLILGILSVLISFLFVGRKQGTYQSLIVGGFLASAVFYLTILFGKESTRSKLIWSLIVVSSLAINGLTAPFFVKSSYLIYFNAHKNELVEANIILAKIPYDISVLKDTINDRNGLLTLAEKEELHSLRQKLDVYLIAKTENAVYFGLWGFLDVRLGLTYWTKDGKPDGIHGHLVGKWYY